MIQIEKITGEFAQLLCQTLTTDLPEYFGLPEANKHYVRGVKTRTNFAAKKDNDFIGLISIDLPASLFETYYQEQEKSKRIIWVAYDEGQCAGYITLKWDSLYEPFAKSKIPEIMDLNVLPAFRQRGIGSRLLDVAEKETTTHNSTVGIGVGLYGGPDGGYGAAQRIYVKRGYIPDGLGATYQYKRATPGASYSLDDDLILWFTKKLR